MVFFLACQLHAQSTVADLRTRLIHQPLYLRGQWREDKLRFDASGQLIGTSALTTFTIAGIDIRSVDLKGDRLVLKGKRAGLEFKQDQPERVVIDQEPIQIEIAAPPGGDYTLPLDHILTLNFIDLLQPMPSYWRPFAQEHLLPRATPAATNASTHTPAAPAAQASTQPPQSSAQPLKAGGNVTAPRLLVHTEPQFGIQARSLRYSARVLVQFVVDATGAPSQLVLLHPAGLELDERALAAVAHYRFAPATRNGQPVPVQLEVAVDFQIF